MTLPVSAGFSSMACQICGAARSATQIFLPLEADLRSGDDALGRLRRQSVTLTSCCRFSKTHMAMASSLPVRCRRKFSLGISTASRGSLVGVDGDVVGEEIRQDDEAARAFDAQLARAGPGSAWTAMSPRLMRNLAGDLVPLRGLVDGFQRGRSLGVLHQASWPRAFGRVAVGGQQTQP